MFIHLIKEYVYYNLKFSDVTDVDTPSNNITYTVLEMTAGYIAMKNNTSVAHRRFSQGNIDRGEVIFVHTSKYDFRKTLSQYP